jgi:hypothetical protein
LPSSMCVAISVFHFIVGVSPFVPFVCPRINAAHNGCSRLHDNFFTNSLASCFALLCFQYFPYKRYFFRQSRLLLFRCCGRSRGRGLRQLHDEAFEFGQRLVRRAAVGGRAPHAPPNQRADAGLGERASEKRRESETTRKSAEMREKRRACGVSARMGERGADECG